MPMSGRGRWTVESDGSGALVVAVVVVVVAAGVVSGVVWLLADTVFVPVAIAVVSVLCVAGIGCVVWQLRHPAWGPVSQGESDAMLRLRCRRFNKAPVPVAIAKRAVTPAAIEKPKPVLAGVVIESRETVR